MIGPLNRLPETFSSAQDETVIDQHNRQTFTRYDLRGQTIETRQETSVTGVFLISRTVYDDKGRVSVSMDQYRGDSNGIAQGGYAEITGTRYTYLCKRSSESSWGCLDFGSWGWVVRGRQGRGVELGICLAA